MIDPGLILPFSLIVRQMKTVFCTLALVKIMWKEKVEPKDSDAGDSDKIDLTDIF